jgi:hypothetical protein
MASTYSHCRCQILSALLDLQSAHAPAAAKLLEGGSQWFYEESIGGRYVNFIMCRGEHLTILTLSYLTEICRHAGFVNIQQCRPVTQTYHSAVIDNNVLSKESESTPDIPPTLIIEAEKP